MKKMNATRDALLALPDKMLPVRKAAIVEIESAEAVAAMLREIIEAHWKGATHSDMRELVRKAEPMLRAFES